EAGYPIAQPVADCIERVIDRGGRRTAGDGWIAGLREAVECIVDIAGHAVGVGLLPAVAVRVERVADVVERRRAVLVQQLYKPAGAIVAVSRRDAVATRLAR